MKDAGPRSIAVAKAIDTVMRQDRGRILSGLITRLGDFDLAEDALQEAMISAMGHWGRNGLPSSPTGWLMRVALNKAIDRIRGAAREANKASDLARLADNIAALDAAEEIPDERLRLIFACCHPALGEKSRVSLTLRSVCGLSTPEIAANFLDSETTMGQRLSRAKASIKAKGISFTVPGPDMWPERLRTVLSTIYLIFTTGYVTEEQGQRDLCPEAIFLARLLDQLRPNEAEIEGALALMLLTDARKKARTGPDGASMPVAEQDRTLWQQTQILEAQAILAKAVERKSPGPFQIKAAIADCHMMVPGPDWRQMALLYGALWQHEPTPVIALNWAVVLAEAGDATASLEKVEALAPELVDYQPWHAARAHLLTRLGRDEEAKQAFEHAIDMAPNAATRRYLEKQRNTLDAAAASN